MSRVLHCPYCGRSGQWRAHLCLGTRVAELLAIREWAADASYQDKVDEIDLELNKLGLRQPTNDNHPKSHA